MDSFIGGGSWVYRTFFAPSFNLHVEVNVEFDGKPYAIKRILKCRRELASSEIFQHTYGWIAQYPSFGQITDTGEVIIVVTPNVCNGRTSKSEWAMDIPSSFIPLIAVGNKLDPDELVIYASEAAYHASGARLKFIGITVKSAQGASSQKFNNDGTDDYAWLGTHPISTVYDTDAPKRVEWMGMNFIEIPEKLWRHNSNLRPLNEKLLKKLNDVKKPEMLFYTEAETFYTDKNQVTFMRNTYPWHGDGLFSGLTIKNEQRPFLLQETYFNLVTPYRLQGDVWRPSLQERGQIVIFRKDDMKDNAQRITGSNPDIYKYFSRKMEFDSDNFDYLFWYGIHSDMQPFSALYLPMQKSVHIPVLSGTKKFKRFNKFWY